MKKGLTFAILMFCPFLVLEAANPKAEDEVFEMNGIWIGQPLRDARERLPSLNCENSCIADNQYFMKKPGRLWAGLKDGKIDQLAFRFRPVLADGAIDEVRSSIIKKYGEPSGNLGFRNCDEWKAHGGFLVLCLTDEVSHAMWSNESRMDANSGR
ncbi:hypothetical protein [Pseudoxanthomonas mexicana]|uniref:hypothetical protein n=1 Tax=Pseudoxanthomonas mexicana TaxID=128785 RepID=UPI00398A6019